MPSNWNIETNLCELKKLAVRCEYRNDRFLFQMGVGLSPVRLAAKYFSSVQAASLVWNVPARARAMIIIKCWRIIYL